MFPGSCLIVVRYRRREWSGRGRLRLDTGVVERTDDVTPEFIPDLSEPNDIDVRPRVDVLLDLIDRFPAPIRQLERIRNGCAIEATAKDMHDFVFNQAVGHYGAVIHRKHKYERAAN